MQRSLIYNIKLLYLKSWLELLKNSDGVGDTFDRIVWLDLEVLVVAGLERHLSVGHFDGSNTSSGSGGPTPPGLGPPNVNPPLSRVWKK